MKKTIITALFLMTAIMLTAVIVGKIRFINGEVLYRENQNRPYTKTTIGAAIHDSGYIKTGIDSEAEITWNNNTVDILEANSEYSITKLLEKANSQPSFRNKLWNNLNSLKLQNTRRATSVAGIRREEAEVEKDKQLFWSTEDSINIEEAISLYDAGNLDGAIKMFEQIIYQGPLSKNAELAHAYLILIYTDQGKNELAEKQIKILQTDFPGSTVLNTTTNE